jgi:Tfp pilus assembly protein PilF
VWLQLAEQLAPASAALGHTDEAERWYREALATARRVHGERHIATAYQAENYGMFLAGHGRAREASELLDLSIAIQAEGHGADSEELAMSYANRGTFRYEQRDLVAAIDDLSRATRLGGDRPEGIYAAVQLGRALSRTGRRREALASLADGIARAERTGQDQVAHIAAARLEAATLLWSTARARARDHAAAALATYRHLGDQAGATEAEAWFRQRGAAAPR